MSALTDRVWFAFCLMFGRLLRAGRYSRVQFVNNDGGRFIKKQRAVYAPLLVWLGGPLMRLLDTGVRVLPQREWEELERALYGRLYCLSIRCEGGRSIVLPLLPGITLGKLLEDGTVNEVMREQAIDLAVSALRQLHAAGITHGDAMAENVLVDLDAGAARWFDFETRHDQSRPVVWRRADDLRALVATVMLRTREETRHATLHRMMDSYGDHAVVHTLEMMVRSVCRRPLAFHLGQAGLSFEGTRRMVRAIADLAPRSRESASLSPSQLP